MTNLYDLFLQGPAPILFILLPCIPISLPASQVTHLMCLTGHFCLYEFLNICCHFVVHTFNAHKWKCVVFLILFSWPTCGYCTVRMLRHMTFCYLKCAAATFYLPSAPRTVLPPDPAMSTLCLIPFYSWKFILNKYPEKMYRTRVFQHLIGPGIASMFSRMFTPSIPQPAGGGGFLASHPWQCLSLLSFSSFSICFLHCVTCSTQNIRLPGHRFCHSL